MRSSASWAIDSETIQAQGIIVKYSGSVTHTVSVDKGARYWIVLFFSSVNENPSTLF